MARNALCLRQHFFFAQFKANAITHTLMFRGIAFSDVIGLKRAPILLKRFAVNETFESSRACPSIAAQVDARLCLGDAKFRIANAYPVVVVEPICIPR